MRLLVAFALMVAVSAVAAVQVGTLAGAEVKASFDRINAAWPQ